MDDLLAITLSSLRFVMAGLALAIVAGCLARLARRHKFVPQEAFLLSVITRDRLPLARRENAVGRSPRCDVVLNLPTVSRFHAVIALRRGSWMLYDTGSQGGTKIDGALLDKQAPLSHGQTVAFGSMEYIFVNSEFGMRNF